VQIFLEKKNGETVQQLAAVPLQRAADADIKLKIVGQGREYSFYYEADGWQPLLKNDDGSILSTEVAGGFVGATLGPHARLEP
jgi:alpha-N-arabinofuranosidase